MQIDLPLSPEEKADIASKLFEHIESRTTDLAAETLSVDPALYTDPAIGARERDVIFRRHPIIAAHSSEVPSRRDLLTVRMPNNELVIVRQEDGSLRAFVNSCRHRGARLVNDEQGKHRLLTCGYHGWTYDLDGSLRSISGSNTFGDVQKDCLSLVAVPVEERHGCIWVVDNPAGEIDVAAWLGAEMDDLLGSYELESYTCYRTGTFSERVNWKALFDAFLDNYHIAATHTKTVAPHFYSNTQTFRQLGKHGQTINPRKSIDAIRQSAPGSLPIDAHVTMAHFIMPNTSFLRQPDHFELLNFMPHPHDMHASTMSIRLLIKTPADSESARSRWDKNWDILMGALRDEDIAMNVHLQEAVANRDAPPLVIGRNEAGNQLFHAWLAAELGQ